MDCNSFGRHIIMTTMGASHDPYLELSIDKFPKGIEVDYILIDNDLQRRSSRCDIDTPRRELDKYTILSGVEDGVTNGEKIVVRIENSAFDSSKYSYLENFYRPSHADYVFEKKYGTTIPAGGGRFSARETVMRVVAGAFCKMLTNKITDSKNRKRIEYNTWVYSIGNICNETYSEALPENMLQYLREIKAEGDSVGGSVKCVVKNVPAGVGEPIFNKLHAYLGYAMLSIPGVKAFEIGRGVEASKLRGSQHNDPYFFDSQRQEIVPAKNDAGGIIGGITTGEVIILTVHFKPIASIAMSQRTCDKTGTMSTLTIQGAHDVCCAVRAVAVVEAMAAFVLADALVR